MPKDRLAHSNEFLILMLILILILSICELGIVLNKHEPAVSRCMCIV